MDKKIQSKKNILVKVAYKMGERSVGRCVFWFNQPQIPEKLKKTINSKELKINE